MARILQALVNVSTDIANENKTRIAFTYADMLEG